MSQKVAQNPPQLQKLVREILPKKLAVVRRTWTTKNGSNSSLRARIWDHKKSKYSYHSLAAKDTNTAIVEALDLYRKFQPRIEAGFGIGKDKPLSAYIEEFMRHMVIREKNGKITPRRVSVVRHLLRSLEKFAEERATKESIEDLPFFYERHYENWRDETLTILTGTKLTPRSRNNEYSAHRQFFGFLKDREIVKKVPAVNLQGVPKDMVPFPPTKYTALVAAMRRGVESAGNPKDRWNYQIIRTLILLMNGTGCRVTECKNLRWDDIFLDGKKNPRVKFRGKKKEREINISPRVHGYLEDLKQFKTLFGKSWDWNQKDYPFVFSGWRRKDQPKIIDSAQRRKWYSEIGIDPHLFPLVSFRHSFISKALSNGVHALQIGMYCGTSVKMIETTYGHVTSPILFKQVFANAPLESLERHSSKWFSEMLAEKEETQK